MRIPKPVAQAYETVFVARREPVMGAQFFGENIQIDNAPVIVEPQGAPDPIRQSGYSGVGRSPGQQSADVPVSLHLNIAGIHAVMSDVFLAGKVRAPFLSLMRNGLGGQLPFQERQIIERGQSAPYGGRATIQASNPGAPSIQAARGRRY